jgi:hypothetical protein
MLCYNHNSLYKIGNILKFYWLGFKNKFVIAVNLSYPCSLHSSFAVHANTCIYMHAVSYEQKSWEIIIS